MKLVIVIHLLNSGMYCSLLWEKSNICNSITFYIFYLLCSMVTANLHTHLNHKHTDKVISYWKQNLQKYQWSLKILLSKDLRICAKPWVLKESHVTSQQAMWPTYSRATIHGTVIECHQLSSCFYTHPITHCNALNTLGLLSCIGEWFSTLILNEIM